MSVSVGRLELARLSGNARHRLRAPMHRRSVESDLSPVLSAQSNQDHSSKAARVFSDRSAAARRCRRSYRLTHSVESLAFAPLLRGSAAESCQTPETSDVRGQL